MDINVAQVVVSASVSLLVGAGSAWFAGTLGVRHGLEQAKRERAFDRRLDWYERAIRVSMRFQRFNDAMAIFLKPKRVGELQKLAQQVDGLTEELTQTINESLIFADRKMYLNLKKTFAKWAYLDDKISKMNQEGAKDETIAEQYDSMSKVVEEIAFDLAVSIRDILSLDRIPREDFEKVFKYDAENR